MENPERLSFWRKILFEDRYAELGDRPLFVNPRELSEVLGASIGPAMSGERKISVVREKDFFRLIGTRLNNETVAKIIATHAELGPNPHRGNVLRRPTVSVASKKTSAQEAIQRAAEEVFKKAFGPETGVKLINTPQLFAALQSFVETSDELGKVLQIFENAGIREPVEQGYRTDPVSLKLAMLNLARR